MEESLAGSIPSWWNFTGLNGSIRPRPQGGRESVQAKRCLACEASSGEGNIKYACGVILLLKPLFPKQTPSLEDKFEFFVWIEGPYRNQGIGRDRDCVQQALETIWGEVKAARQGRPFHPFIRYPEEGSADGDEPLERALWSNFFHYYDFHRAKSEKFGRRQDLILACRSDQRARGLQQGLASAPPPGGPNG
jgi:hypothetical protein